MSSLVMYDGITHDVPLLPADGDIYAGYDDGSYNDVVAIATRFPSKPVVSIDVTGGNPAQALDVENGDATPAAIDPWLANLALTGPVFDLPIIYMSVDVAKVNFPTAHPNGCLLWTAHYTNTLHICGPTTCGVLPYSADMTQWLSVNDYDESAVNPAHFIWRGITVTTPIPGNAVKTQDQWGACAKCSCLVFVGYGGNVCAAGGKHDVSTSYDYTLLRG